MKEFNVKTLRKNEKQEFVQRSTCHGEHEDEFKASRGRKYQRKLTTNLPWRVHVPWREDYSRGELRRPNPLKLTWQKLTEEESSTRHGEQITCHGEFNQNKNSIKALSSFQKGIIIIYATLGGEKTGKHRETLKEQGAQGLKGFTRSLRHHGLLPFHLFFSPCKVTMTMSI